MARLLISQYMNIQKHVVVLCTVLVVLSGSCGGGKNDVTTYKIEQAPPFTLEDAYFQDWVAGTKDGGSGTNVYMNFRSLQKAVEPQEMYFRSMIAKVQNITPDNNLYVANFRNGMVPDRIMDINPTKEAQNTPPRPFPFNLSEDEAVLSYLHKGVLKYAKISKLRREAFIAYPGKKPKGDN